MYKILLDYLTLNFESGTFTPESLSEFFTSSKDFLMPMSNKANNSVWYSPFGVSFMSDNGNRVSNKTQTIRFSGVGTETFEQIIPILIDKYDCTCSRADFAIDVDMSVKEWHNFIDTVYYERVDGDAKSRYNLITGTTFDAATVYIGNRRGRNYFRIYNKTCEQKESPVNDKYKIRYEVEVKYTNNIRRGNREVFTPMPLVMAYYNCIKEYVSSYVINSWRENADEFLIPKGFNPDDCELRNNVKILLSSNDESMLKVSKMKLTEKNTEMMASVNYVYDRYGHLIVAGLNNEYCKDIAERKFKNKTGIDVIVQAEVYYNEEDYVNPFEYTDENDSYEQLGIESE